MEQYFVKRADGDLAETQLIVSEVGHSIDVRKAYVEAFKKKACYESKHFVSALKKLLKELGKQGYTKDPNGINAPGGRFTKFEDLTIQQIFGRFATVQQAVAKWVYKAVGSKDELWIKLIEEDLVFKANDVEAVMNLLFSIFDHNGYLAYDYEERGFDAFQQRMLSCVTK